MGRKEKTGEGNWEGKEGRKIGCKWKVMIEG
jgi:hypothetical protein